MVRQTDGRTELVKHYRALHAYHGHLSSGRQTMGDRQVSDTFWSTGRQK